MIKENKPTICLTMIVKNESHIIKKTLEILCNKINFSYWIICDTGSNDNTPQIILDFFNDKNIRGELHHHKWVNFAHNRTLSMELSYNKTDLAFIFDADDEIHGNINLPNEVEYDGYYLFFGGYLSYKRLLLVNNRIQWKYESVVHEYIVCLKENHKFTELIGDYYIISGKSGSRSKDPNKYLNDALLLENEWVKTKEENNILYLRYAFYCANSYRDYGDFHNAIKWYKITLSQNNWNQEKYISCLNLYRCYSNINDIGNGIYYLLESVNYDRERLECAYYIIKYYFDKQLFSLAYNYYKNYQNFFENIYSNLTIFDKLFAETIIYDFLLPYHLIIICSKENPNLTDININNTIINCFKTIFMKKYNIGDADYLSNFLYNFQFFIHLVKNDTTTLKLFQEYLNFWVNNGVNFRANKYDFLLYIQNYGIKFINQIDTNNKNILFYTGYMNFKWNYTYSLNNALGGSENAVINLAKEFPKDYNIYVSGDVEEETIDNLIFINNSNLNKLLKNVSFNTVIISRYLDFYDKYPNCVYNKSIIWGHDICLFNYGTSLSVENILQKHYQKINFCVCQTEWHQNLFKELYPCLKDKLTNINNGISIEKFIYKPFKILNRFIYTSCTERGLDKLINLWPQIIEQLPNAELFICSYNDFPKNEEEINLQNKIKQYSNIIHLGKLSKDKLYELMSSAEYWLYPTNFQETSCITAMEMLMSEVICIYYPIAGLVNTIGKYGIQVEEGTEIETIIQLTNKDKNILRKNGKEYAINCSWKNRFITWNKLLQISNGDNDNNNDNDNDNDSINYKIKIINLKKRVDRKNKMINKLNKENITNYEFFEAIDGTKLECTPEIIKLFERNDFNYKKGVLGCTLSHLYLWKELIDDEENDFYVILEDDINLCDNFKFYLDQICKNFFKEKLEHLSLCEHNSTKQYPNKNTKIYTYIKDVYKEGSISFAYIISKEAINKIFSYINTCSIKCAIDNPQMCGNILKYSALNVKLINTMSEDGTDIQITNNPENYLKIEHTKNINKKQLTYSFCDWWYDEYCGGIFDYNDNFFINLLKQYGNNYNFQLIKPQQNPDILFYSIFGNSHKEYIAKRKIFYSGEPYGIRKDANYNITFDPNSIINVRLPLWVCYITSSDIELFKNSRINNIDLNNKTKFCSFIASGPGLTNNREEFVNKLTKYKKVDCGGRYLNNLDHDIPRGINCSGKINHNKQYKFAMAFESKNYPGYITEKICDIFKSNTIPIYWGTKDIFIDFNPSTFINANDFASFDELVNYIIKVDNDDELYLSYFKEPVLHNRWIDIFSDPNKNFFKNIADKIIGENDNLFNNLNKIQIYEEKYYSANKIDEFLSKYIFKGFTNGYFMDIGANDGITINNTLYFEKYYNWKGINVEPLDEPYSKLIINRPNCINLNLAIDSSDGETEFIYNTGYTEMISGIKKTYDSRHYTRLLKELEQEGGTSIVKLVKTKTIKTILKQYNIKHIHYLSIYVEGGEKEVLQSIDFNEVFIDIISFEDNFFDITEKVINFMENNNYILIGKFGDIIMIHKNSMFLHNLDYNKIMQLTYDTFNCYGLQPNMNLKSNILNINN